MAVFSALTINLTLAGVCFAQSERTLAMSNQRLSPLYLSHYMTWRAAIEPLSELRLTHKPSNAEQAIVFHARREWGEVEPINCNTALSLQPYGIKLKTNLGRSGKTQEASSWCQNFAFKPAAINPSIALFGLVR
jgi:hypothetical protein